MVPRRVGLLASFLVLLAAAGCARLMDADQERICRTIIPAINPRMQACLIPSATLHLYHGGHLAILTEANELAPIIDRFLDSTEGTVA